MQKKFPVDNSHLSQTNLSNLVCTVVHNKYKSKSAFNSPIYAFSLAGNIIVYTQSQGSNRGKLFLQINYKDKKC